jgi:hypothetical protein
MIKPLDAASNPFAPGAGTPPPELAGRDELLERVRVAIARVRAGRAAKSVLLIGLRGAGKTVLLDRMRDQAEAAGVHTIRVEAPEKRSLPGLLAPELRRALLRISREERARDLATRALRALAGFVMAFKVKYQDIEVGLDVEPEPGLADNGDLEQDLQALLEAVGAAAREAGTALAIFIDELQYVEEEQLSAFITALHRVAQRQLPVILVGAGLPQLRGRTGRAKSYAERLFDFPEVGPLSAEAAEQAIVKPIRAEGADITPDAVSAIIETTQGYPYFLQEWGSNAWDAADDSPITAEDVALANATAIAALDASFFGVRFDRLTLAEKRYLRAMAELGPGPHRSGDIADILGRKVTSVAPVRAQLIDKGMIWSPSHGDTAFTVPLFDEFMRRVMSDQDWRTTD